jgi:drug/metabolite transporter (DMT)-like permease
MLIAHPYLPGERLNARKMAGVLLGVVGRRRHLLEPVGRGGRMALAGSAAVVVGAACVAWANVLVKARGAKLDPAVLAAGRWSAGSCRSRASGSRSRATR